MTGPALTQAEIETLTEALLRGQGGEVPLSQLQPQFELVLAWAVRVRKEHQVLTMVLERKLWLYFDGPAMGVKVPHDTKA